MKILKFLIGASVCSFISYVLLNENAIVNFLKSAQSDPGVCIFPGLVMYILWYWGYVSVRDMAKDDVEKERSAMAKEKRNLDEEKQRFAESLQPTMLDLERKTRDLEAQQEAAAQQLKANRKIQAELTKARAEQDEYCKKQKVELDKTHSSRMRVLADRENKLENEYSSKMQALVDRENKFASIIEEKKQSFPYLADLISEFEYIEDLKKAKNLSNKKNPALKAAEEVREIAAQKRALQKANKMLEYQLHYYETLFPWLEDFKEVEPEHGYRYATNTEYTGSADPVKNWISPEEYAELSVKEKNQLALDKYLKRNKSNWEIGIDFERYIGCLCEQQGHRVIYNGAREGLEDMGRDLIVSASPNTYVIQCKRWSKSKTIHEKHIFQLYGSVIELRINNNDDNITGVFITTAELSPTAKRCADYLGIIVKENIVAGEYPRIKCNISGRDKEKIYHLPFDQQYDNIVIEQSKGECYAWTVAEAEEKGFRRAYKWKPTYK